MASDDASVLNMNTNAVDSIDPAGKVEIGRFAGATAATQLAVRNIPLTAGQNVSRSLLGEEGGGGDGLRLAYRRTGNGRVGAAMLK